MTPTLLDQARELLPKLQKQALHGNDVFVLKAGDSKTLISILTAFVDGGDTIDRLNKHLDTFKYANDLMTIVQIRNIISAKTQSPTEENT